VPTPDPKDVKIAELTSALEAATAAGNQVISERDALAQKVNAIKQIVA
jgi:hypothetical protein